MAAGKPKTQQVKPEKVLENYVPTKPKPGGGKGGGSDSGKSGEPGRGSGGNSGKSG